ncbi:V-type ATP synthase subunit B [Candidatus Haloredivivus sp. G17]|nr:V-type ATP synthase subunit B [Candidatus Haloredivivus sp. G17]
MVQQEYKTINEVKGPLVFVEKTEDIAYGDIVEIETPNGDVKQGEVLETSKDVVVVQVYEETQGIGQDAKVRFMDENVKMPVTEDLLGRVLDGKGDPIDDGPEVIPDEERDIQGEAINTVLLMILSPVCGSSSSGNSSSTSVISFPRSPHPM